MQGGQIMKIRTKIQLIFGGTVIILLGAVGGLSYMLSYQNSLTLNSENMASSAVLVANDAANQIKNFVNTAELIGKENILNDNTISAEEKISLVQKYVDTYGFVNSVVTDVNGRSISDGADYKNKECVTKALLGEASFSEIKTADNNYDVAVAAPIQNNEGQINGAVYLTVDKEFLNECINDISLSDNGRMYIMTKDCQVMSYANGDAVVSSDEDTTIQGGLKDIIGEDAGKVTYNYGGYKLFCGFSPIENTNNWTAVIFTPEADYEAEALKMVNKIVACDFIAIVIALGVAVILATYISNSVNGVKNMLINVAKGDLKLSGINKTKKKDEIGILHNTTVDLLGNLSGMISETNNILASIANYNLNVSNMKEYPGEYNTLSNSVNSIKEILSQIIIQLQRSSVNVESGSRQLADAASNLSEGTVTQAASIQNLVADIENITDKIHNSSENGELVNEKLSSLDMEIKTSNQQMSELLSVVREVAEMSEDIQKIVGTIDSIAFQTNILALNASVEAARAGSKGKGFAVVAEEVRSLASKCADASKKTEELIESCIDGIDRAKECADTTFSSLNLIVANSEEISSAFEDIAKDTKQQGIRATAIKKEIENVSDVVQSNTATTEQTAAASEELSQQAFELRQMTSKFNL